jgi:hypothetical protein
MNIASEITNRLKTSQYWSRKTKQRGKYIQELICPECGRPEAWCYASRPFSINCNRQNNCCTQTPTLQLFPDIIQNVETEYPATKEDPNAPARQYLISRGLAASIDSLNFEYWKQTRDGCSGAVMFPISTENGNRVLNGRIFAPPKGQGKTHNVGKVAGKIWKHPAIKYDPERETFVTEGIIDALSLIEMGLQAIAVLSAGQDPSNIDLSEFNKLVFAFDNDTAGHRALKRWKRKHPAAGAIMPTTGDWNDLLISGQEFKKHRKQFEFNASLAQAETAQEYAVIYFDHYDHAPGLFEFEGCLYFSFLKVTQKTQEVITTRASNFTLRVDHFILDTTNADEPSNKFYLKIKPQKGRTASFAAAAFNLRSAVCMREFFLQRGRVLFEGNEAAALALARKIVNSRAPVVRQLQTVGFDPVSGCYVFQGFMINHKGEFIKPNERGFFAFKPMMLLKAASHPTINPVKGIAPEALYQLICKAWPHKAAAALAWLIASWFVNQIKAKLNFFPFLSLYGDTQTGKTVLTRLLNACQCLDEEGLPMRKVNTSKGEIRKLAQRSGLFKALLESNQGDNVRFDMGNILTLYNSNILQTRALRTNDIQTQDINFLASLLFVQNKEPFNVKAQKERVISLQFKKDQITDQTTEAFSELIQIPAAELAWFFVHTMQQRCMIEAEWPKYYQDAKKDLAAIADARLIENHALVLAFHRLLIKVLNIEYDLQPYALKIGQNKFIDCNRIAEDLAQYFFEVVLSLDDELKENALAIDIQDDQIFVNLPGAIRAMQKAGFPINFQVKQLQAELKDHPAFIKSNISHRFGFPYYDRESDNHFTEEKISKAWVFDASKLDDDESL